MIDVNKVCVIDKGETDNLYSFASDEGPVVVPKAL